LLAYILLDFMQFNKTSVVRENALSHLSALGALNTFIS
jgi:hypothetical protein